MYKIDIDHPCSVNGVCVLNVDTNIKSRLDYQLEPLIKEIDGVSNYYIFVMKGDNNQYELSGDTLFITYNNDSYLMNTLRKSVRDILYDPFLQFGYTKMHCSSVKKEDDVYVILGTERVGKTSTALGLCQYEGFSFIGGDLALIKDNDLIGWQTCISARRKTVEMLDLNKSSQLLSSNDKEYFWIWPNEYEELGYSISKNGLINKCVFHHYDFDGINEEKILSLDEFREKLIQNIHYDEINKDNYWNMEPVDLNKCISNIENSSLLNDCNNAIEVTSTGLSKNNIKRLVKVMR